MLGDFNFSLAPPGPAPADERFTPSFAAMRDERGDSWLGVSFASCLDGVRGMRAHGRPPLDLVVVVDVSGSMSCQFAASGQGYGGDTKLDIAKLCVHGILPLLRPQDRFSLVSFTTAATTLTPLLPVSAESIANAKERIEELEVRTNLDPVGPPVA